MSNKQLSIINEQMKNRKTTNHPSIFGNRRSIFKVQKFMHYAVLSNAEGLIRRAKS